MTENYRQNIGWRELFYETAEAIKTPLLIDNVTKNRLFGHYVRVLVDLYLSGNTFYEVMVEHVGYAIAVEIEYEGLLEFCTNCKSIDHKVLYVIVTSILNILFT